MTTYGEVQADDRDVAAFLATQLTNINIWRLPLKAWVARRDGQVIAVLTLQNVTYPALHVHIVAPVDRPFVALYRLWMLAALWLQRTGIPVICAPVQNHLHHFQSLLRRLGFVKIGEESDENGNVTETIYGYYFKENVNDNPSHEVG